MGITCIVNDHSTTYLKISKMSKFSENLKKHNFALISETVRDGAKQTKNLDHMYSQCSQHNIKSLTLRC